MKKKILIIGGKGYIGSLLFDKLSPIYKVSQIDLVDKYDYKNIPMGLIQDQDVIILLAGHSSVRMCGDFKSAFDNNVQNFDNLMAKLEQVDKRIKLIYASSSSVYGYTAYEATEEHSIENHNHYDTTKYLIDLIRERYDVEAYGLRFGAVNGWSPTLRTDIMINAMYHDAITDGKIRVFASDIYRPILGTNDLVKAMKAIIECEEDHRGVYNVASFNATVDRVARNISKTMDIPIDQIAVPHNFYVYDYMLDSSLFEKTFNITLSDNIKSILETFKGKEYTPVKRIDPVKYE